MRKATSMKELNERRQQAEELERLYHANRVQAEELKRLRGSDSGQMEVQEKLKAQDARITWYVERIERLEKTFQEQQASVDKLNPLLDKLESEWATVQANLDTFMEDTDKDLEQLFSTVNKLETKQEEKVNKSSPEDDVNTEYLDWLRKRIHKQRSMLNINDVDLDHTLSHCMALIDVVKETGGV